MMTSITGDAIERTESRGRFSETVAMLCALLVLMCFGCAGVNGPPDPPGIAGYSPGGEDAFMDRAQSLYDSGDYGAAAELLRSVAQQGYAYNRMDELLYWIGKCRYAQGDHVRAMRAFSMLEKYYPSSDTAVEGLDELVVAVQESIVLEHDAGGGLLSVESGPPQAAWVAREAGGNPVAELTVTNVFYETDVRQAIADIAAQTGVSIVPDARVTGYVTVEFANTPLEQALDQLLSPLGLTYRRMDNYYLVGSPSLESPSFTFLTETRKVVPKYLSCEEVKVLLPSAYEKYLRLDTRCNTLTITAPPSIIRKFEEDLSRVDRPQTQIMIEAMVVEMSSEVTRSLGLDWEWFNRAGSEAYRIARTFPAGADSSFTGEFARVKTALDLHLILRALVAEGKAKIRANPRVATVDGHEAEIRIAREVYFSLIQGSVHFPYFTLEKIPSGITLRITPNLGESSEIATDIMAEVSDVVGSGANDLPVTNVRAVTTRIRVANGETIGIGGLVSEREQKETNRIPLLGRIPYLGMLFGHTTRVKEESEIVILITPHILINPAELATL